MILSDSNFVNRIIQEGEEWSLMNNVVSTVIPTYKSADMLDRAIQSVLNQTYPFVEVVVVDDNNPDTEWRKNGCQ